MSKLIWSVSEKLKDDYSKNVVLNYFFRIFGIVLGLISTRLVLGYLGATLYGLWVTITSIVSWMSSGDLGIGNGLRNELATAYGQGDKVKVEKLISVAFSSMRKIAVVLLIVITLLSELFFQTNILDSNVRLAMYITSIFFCVNLVMGISQSIALGCQKSWLTTMTTCEIQVLTILSVMVLKFIKINPNLTWFSIINGLCTLIPYSLLFMVLKRYGIDVAGCVRAEQDKEILKTIIGTGLQFFGIQICSIVLYSTDSLLINKLMSSEMVTKYSIITKIFDTGSSLFSILLIALWSAVTYNIARNNIQWIKDKIRQLLIYWACFSFGIIIVGLLFNSIVKIWLGNSAVYFEWNLICLFGVYCSMTAFSAIFVNVLNGMGIIKLQLVLSVIAAVLNIPLSIIFAKQFSMGIFGIKLATFVSALITAIVIPLHTVREIKKKEKQIQINMRGKDEDSNFD